MAESSFSELRSRRLRYVESARDNDFEEGLRTLLADLYPDNAHFIYELLQNAEDAGAKTVRFELDKKNLTVTHDGSRPFNIENVEAITSIGKSTKRDDVTQIGKFGVGFKAVFAYTNNPEVHAEQHSFVIRDLFVPDPIDSKAIPGHTTFVFPFDRVEKSASVAFAEIERGLAELAGTSVLFLSSVSTIAYSIDGADEGSISRDDRLEPEIRITETVNGIPSETSWIRLVGAPQRPEVSHLRVSAAFLLSTEAAKPNSAKSTTRTRIQPLDQGDTCIYFPAAKEGSGLKFHIHAPFASTVARDSVRDTPENVALVQSIGELIASSLPELRDRGLIDDGFLAALPNQDDALAAPYAIIRDVIIDTFEREPVTPSIGGGYAPATALVRSPSQFRGAFTETDLGLLTSFLEREYGDSPKWIPERDLRAGRFLSALRAKEFGWDELDDVFGAVETRGADASESLKRWTAWLDGKSVSQQRALFELLGLGFEEHEFPIYRSHLRNFAGPLVRVRDGDGSKLEAVQGVFLPSTPEDATSGRVLAELSYFEGDEQTKARNRIAAFYQGMGIGRWDDEAAIEQRLNAYRSHDWPDTKQQFSDLREFVAYLRSNPRSAKIFEGTKFIRVEYPDADYRYTAPAFVFLDAPYRETGLSTIFTNKTKFALWSGYKGKVAGIEDFVLAAGGLASLTITKARIHDNAELREVPWWDGRRTDLGTEQDWKIEHLQVLLDSGDPRLLRLLWDLCCESPERYMNAIYQRNGQSRRYIVRSQLAIALSETPWVLDRTGQLRTAESMTVEELPEGWPRPPVKSLALALGFGSEAIARDSEVRDRVEKAEAAGVPFELVEAWRELPDEMQTDMIREIGRRAQASKNFPSSSSVDPTRRAAIVGGDAAVAPAFETEKRQRSVVIGKSDAVEISREYLRAEYTSDDGVMFCQACHSPVPFTVKGRGYFESVQCVAKRARTHHQNTLALCPLCAALYKHARGTEDEALVSMLVELEVVPEASRVAVPVLLDQRRVEVWFTGKHALDLKSVLNVAGDARS